MKSTQILKFTIVIVFTVFIFNGMAVTQDLNPNDWPHLKGYWKFQDTNNLTQATVGNDLILIGSHQWVPGPAYGDTAIRIDTNSYYKCYHGMLPNGGGDSVNEYSLMFDFKVLNFERWHTFFQTDTTNSNDGECFIRPNSTGTPGQIGVGYTGYTADSIIANQWYRLVISIDLGNFYNYYLNGALVHVGDTNEILLDGRFALTPLILFFADNNLEDDTIDIASIAIFDTCLTPTQIAQIGSIEPCIANPPVIDLGNDTILCYNHTLQLSATNSYKSYLWSTGDTTASVIIDSATFGYGPDTVWVEVTDMNNCTGTDSIVVTFINCTGGNLGLKKIEPEFYPNPSNGMVYFQLEEPSSISVFSSSGQMVKTFDIKSSGLNKIDLSGLPVGFYWIKINSGNNIKAKKLLITE